MIKLLDLFCGAGGAAMGYHRAGFDVVGVDIRNQPRYPFEFHQADALEYLAQHGQEFNAIHASPPCQRYSVAVRDKSKHPDLLPEVRAALQQFPTPWVIENVPGAPMRADFKLCGCMFGLKRLKRQRWFETSWHGHAILPPCYHPEPVISVCSHDVMSHQRKFGRSITLEEKREAMDIDWMKRDELGQAIPPAYTEFIGKQLLEVITRGVMSSQP